MPSPIAFDRDHTVTYGVLDNPAPGIRRMTAPNASPFTFQGTNTYVVGTGDVAIIDPGPAIQEHIDALLQALRHETITHILVTHTHSDHSPGCALLQQQVDAPTYAMGPHGMSLRDQGLTADEGGDFDFQPDFLLQDQQRLSGDSWQLECVFTPGHTSNHVCFADLQTQALYSGDHVMGWSTSIVSPPDGNMGDYMRSLTRLASRDDRVFWPGHGGPIDQPGVMVQAFIEHRLAREQQILACLAHEALTLSELVPLVYHDIDSTLYPAAARSLMACVVYLTEQQLVAIEAPSSGIALTLSDLDDPSSVNQIANAKIYRI